MKTYAEAINSYVGKNVTVFLMNGFQMKGTLNEVYKDGGIRLTETEYKNVNEIAGHAISTIKESSY